jgi:Rod binding domain-containing protein
MDSSELILTNPVSPPPLLLSQESTGVNWDITQSYPKITTCDPSKIDEFSVEKKRQIAKDFESILINKLLEEMKNTIGDWGFDKDGTSKQVQGIFWLNLAQDIANKGGLGLWKDVYEFLTQVGRTNPGNSQTSKTIESLNENI